MKRSILLALSIACLATPAFAAEPPKVTLIPAPSDVRTIPLNNEGSQASERWEDVNGWRIVRDVTQPALIPVLPKPGTANGTAVIIAPGGGFYQLSMDSEGFKVAQYLADRGITAFVLKYRLDHTPDDYATFRAEVGARPGRPPQNKYIDPYPASLKGQEDGLAAMRWVRAHAADYGIEPHHIGFMGFSAGGITTMGVALNYDATTRPDFIGVIYGAMPHQAIPADAPPAFIVVAADDAGMSWAAEPIFDAWHDAGKPVELHVYAHGAHGFGLRTQGKSSDHWIDDYYNWLKTEILKH